ncbi:hypothetical protein SAMN05216413_2612 [Ruminococcaceae bacterium KH2T8]|nr:hypothetical protein SAMN05216413_2612 [Ruminococcaceae bacterium KH2T8]
MSIFDAMGSRRSVQDLLGIKRFTSYGLLTNNGELLFYQVNPVNISVLSQVSIESKIRQLMHVLSTIPNIEIVCTDSSECFDDNKIYLTERSNYEMNPQIRSLLKKDKEFLDNIQLEMATARQFAFVMRCKNLKPEQVFGIMNRVEKVISEQGFEVKRMAKEDIKRFLALYFDASYNGEHIPDVDGAQFLEIEYEE